MLLFFYGTLGEEMDNPVIRAIRPRLGPARAATVRGALYAFPDRDGWYPALAPDANGEPIAGVLYAPGAGFTAADLATLDAYEAYDPAHPADSEYVRRTIEVMAGDGERVLAEAYVYNRPVSAAARRIAEDSFAAFLAVHGLKPLAPRDP